MTTDIAIVIGTFLLFVIIILTGKVKIHMAAMVIPIVLELTGVLSFSEAWGGLLNSSIVMMASMFVVGAAISKTSLISKMSKALIKPGASDTRIMVGIMVPILFLGCFVNATATMTIMIPLITAICAEQQRPLSKFMYPAAMLTQIWVGWLPTGGNAGGYLANNTIIENLGGLGTWDYFTTFISKAPFVIICIPLVLILGVKMAPDLGNIPTLEEGASAATAATAAAAKRKKGNLTPGQEVKSGNTVIMISNNVTMLVTITVDDKNISFIKPGDYVDLDWNGHVYQGQVSSIDMAGAESGQGMTNYPVTLTVDNFDGSLIEGAYLQYSFVTSESSDCILVPTTAVKYFSDADGNRVAVVFVQRDTPPEEIPDLQYPEVQEGVERTYPTQEEGYYPVVVETGLSDAQNAEIVSGLQEGDVVFVNYTVTDGSYG